jgi:hypothetical protein
MKTVHFQAIELLPYGHSLPTREVIEKLAFNDQGLIPVITRDAKNHQIRVSGESAQ